MMSRMFLFSCLSFLILLSPSVLAWDTEDHEIFDLVSALEAAEGKGTTFYKFLEVPKSASLEEIKKASRKLSLALHPDKHPGNKKIEAKFTRLSLISAILKDEEKRKRYNFFHDNGVPRWKGTGYMYSRWQPGLGFAISFVLMVASLMQYAAQHVNYRTEIERIQRFQTAAKQAAHGKGERSPDESKTVERKKVKISIAQSLANDQGVESEIPVPKSRQERRRMQQAGGSTKVSGIKSTQAGWIDMVVQGDDVWIVAEDGSELLLVESAASKPGFKKTFIPTFITNIFRRFLPRTHASETPIPRTSREISFDDNHENDGDIVKNGQVFDQSSKPSQIKNRNKTAKSKKN